MMNNLVVVDACAVVLLEGNLEGPCGFDLHEIE
jgi:hypothetical protein